MLEYGYFDSEIIGYDNEGMPIFDRGQSSDFIATFISKIVTDGVLADPGDCFQVVAGEGMKVKTRPGFAVIKGRFAVDPQEFEIVVPPAPSAYKRIDRIVIRSNYLQRLIDIVLKEGVPAANPVPPELLQPTSGDYYELSLATIAVNSNQTVITQANITDTRYDSSVCGIITQFIDHIDTSVFSAQLNQYFEEFKNDSESAFQAWFQSIQEFIASAEGGDLLLEVKELIETTFQIPTKDDIANIIAGTYVEVEEE